jgi:hypothetical protein
MADVAELLRELGVEPRVAEAAKAQLDALRDEAPAAAPPA